MSNKTEQDAVGMIPVEHAARLLGITPRWLRKLASQGVIPRATKGRYPLVGVVQGYIRCLRDGLGTDDDRAASISLSAAKTRSLDLKIAREEAGAVDLVDAEQTFAHQLLILREETEKAAAGLPEHIAPAVRAAQKQAFDRAEARAAAAFAALRAGRDPLQNSEA